MKYTINLAKLPLSQKHHRYMRSDSDEYDILGQMLLCHGIDLDYGMRTPEDTGKIVDRLTYNVRGKVSDTVLTLQILNLDVSATASNKLTKLVELMPDDEFVFIGSSPLYKAPVQV